MADLLVFGGSGFIGSTIAFEAARRGLQVACVSRHGRPDHIEARPNIIWVKGDALEPDTYKEHLKQTKAVVVSIGSPPLPFADEDKQVLMNGTTNATVVTAAQEVGVKRVVLVNALMPQWCPSGYLKGKTAAEQAARQFAEAGNGNGAVVLKPSVVYGTRKTASGWPVPMWPVFGPISLMLRALPTATIADAFPNTLKGALAPPVHVSHLAAAAVDAATKDEYAGKFTVIENDALFAFSAWAG